RIREAGRAASRRRGDGRIMTLAERDVKAVDDAAPRKRWSDRAFVQLVLARLREFYREPEAVFWSYVFPLLLIIGLGIAFRNRPVDQMIVDVENGPQSEAAASTLRAKSQFLVTTGDPALCEMRLRTGKTQLVVSASGKPPAYTYHFDPSRPESMLARN